MKKKFISFKKWCLEYIKKNSYVLNNKTKAEQADQFTENDTLICYQCGGRGKIRYFSDCDPIEGYKLAPWHDCSDCNDGWVYYKQIKYLYDIEKDSHKKEFADNKMLKNIKNKLTEEETKFLGI